MFFKSESCQLLDDPTGPGAQRFAHYDAFLNHNHRALRHLAELELLDRGAGLATLASILLRVKDLLEEVSGLVAAVGGLAPGRYQKLPEALERIAGDLAPLTERKREPIRGPLTLPFSALGTNHLPLAGAKAVNLAQIRNRLGLPAPDGFVVTTAAFDLFLRENRLLDPIDDMLAAFDTDGDDIEEACRRIQEKICEAPLPGAPGLAPGAIDRLVDYTWPGNVRELENVVERELILNRKGPLDFRDVLMKQEDNDRKESPIQEDNFFTLDEVMKHHIHRALNNTNGRVHGPKGAAELLGINPSTLRSRMKKLRITYGRRRRH